MTVGVNVKRHTRGWSGSWGMPPHRNEVDWVPISGGGEPSSVPTAKKAPAHEAPASRAAAKAAITVSQKRRAIGGSRVVALCLRISAAHPAAQRGALHITPLDGSAGRVKLLTRSANGA